MSSAIYILSTLQPHPYGLSLDEVATENDPNDGCCEMDGMGRDGTSWIACMRALRNDGKRKGAGGPSPGNREKKVWMTEVERGEKKRRRK
jgi:hypothetical protein